MDKSQVICKRFSDQGATTWKVSENGPKSRLTWSLVPASRSRYRAGLLSSAGNNWLDDSQRPTLRFRIRWKLKYAVPQNAYALRGVLGDAPTHSVFVHTLQCSRKTRDPYFEYTAEHRVYRSGKIVRIASRWPTIRSFLLHKVNDSFNTLVFVI